MKILFYMYPNIEIGAMRIHAHEVLGNLHKMGHLIMYADGSKYSLSSVKTLDRGTRGNHRRSLWGWMKRFMGDTPWRGEALVIWLFLNEVRLFFSVAITILLHRPDVIYRRHNLFHGEYLLARLFHIPSVKEVNGIMADEIKVARRADILMLRLMDRAERFTMPRADKIIVVTPKLKETLHSEYKIDPQKIIVIQNGANTDVFKPIDVMAARETLGLSQNMNYICFVGSLKQWQGVEYLINSVPLIVAPCPESRVLIVGDGPIKQELMNQVERAGMSDKVVFTGMVPYQEVPLYINASDVCVSLKDGLKFGFSPLKLYEYLACGKPVVASRGDGFEIVEDSGCGTLVEPEDSKAIAIAITDLLKDPERRAQMGGNGRRYIVECQSWEKVAERVAEVCQGLVNGRRDGDT